MSLFWNTIEKNVENPAKKFCIAFQWLENTCGVTEQRVNDNMSVQSMLLTKSTECDIQKIIELLQTKYSSICFILFLRKLNYVIVVM